MNRLNQLYEGMKWNYRVMARQFTNTIEFAIYEVYYDKDDEPNAYSAEPNPIIVDESEGTEVLNEVLDKMRTALDKPILWYGERFPQEYRK